MAEIDFSDLIPSQAAPSGADLSFDDLIPQQKPQSILPAAISDVPGEIKSAANSALDNITAIRNRSEQGPIEGLMTTGRAALAVPELLMSPVTGAARSLIGHPLADAEHAVGSLIAPDIAAKDDPQKMYEAAKGDVDLALAGARAGAPKAPTVTAPTIAELKDASHAAYQSPEVLGLEVKPGVFRSFSDQTKLSLNQDGFDDIVAPKTFAQLERIQSGPPGSMVTGQNLNSLRKVLGRIAGGNDPTEKAAASIVIDHLDDFIPNIGARDVIAGDPTAAAEKFAEARGNWAAAKQSEKLDKKIVKAEMQADRSNSGMNLENRIRTAMGEIKVNDKEARGLTPSERAQAAQISEGTKAQNAMRAASNVMGGGGGMAAWIAGAPTLGVAPAVGFGLKLLSNHMTLKQAERLSEAIRMRAPLASSTAKFGQAFANYQASKTPSAYVAAIVAARNLSSNLKGSGMEPAISRLLQSTDRPSARQDER